MKRVISIMLMSVAVLAAGSHIGAKPAQKFALFNLDGKLVTSSSLFAKGNTLISFWASYCVPCKKEMPALADLEKKYRESKKLQFVLINIDKEGKDAAQPVLNSLGVPADCLLDMYQVAAKNFIPDLKIPALFLINTKGEIIFEAVGDKPENLQNLEKAIQRLP
jgi:cytochrome c biogenesis protein CcmG, thiol:disulfide interchange protein DsbE